MAYWSAWNSSICTPSSARPCWYAIMLGIIACIFVNDEENVQIRTTSGRGQAHAISPSRIRLQHFCTIMTSVLHHKSEARGVKVGIGAQGQHWSKIIWSIRKAYHCKWRNVYLSAAGLSSQSPYSTLDRWLTCFNVIGYCDWLSST